MAKASLTEGKTLIIGAGKSGISSAALLKRHGAGFAVFEGAKGVSESDVRAKSDVFGNGVDVFLVDITSEDLKGFTHAVLSPGISVDAPIVRKCRDAGLCVIGELELGYLFSKGMTIAITGTNGKTTTTTLTGDILKRHFKDVYVAGNIGDPYTDIADKTTDDSVCVLEVSSFQLETISEFRAQVSAILNVTPDHLDRHGTMDNYAAMKERVTNRGDDSCVCVLNADNPYCADFAVRCPVRPIMFSSSGILDDGYFLKDGVIMRACGAFKEAEPLISMDEVDLVGTCNAENIMAAIAISRAVGVPDDIILDAVRSFKAVFHRIEYVTTKNGVKYYNDSKGTNPDAAIQGIRAMDGPTYLIAGGYDKNIPFDDWVKAFDGKVKKLVLIGQTARQIADTARKYGVENIEIKDTFEEAFEACATCAKEGENVLLSPACASWGMFKNYEERGDLFKKLAGEL